MPNKEEWYSVDKYGCVCMLYNFQGGYTPSNRSTDQSFDESYCLASTYGATCQSVLSLEILRGARDDEAGQH